MYCGNCGKKIKSKDNRCYNCNPITGSINTNEIICICIAILGLLISLIPFSAVMTIIGMVINVISIICALTLKYKIRELVLRLSLVFGIVFMALNACFLAYIYII